MMLKTRSKSQRLFTSQIILALALICIFGCAGAGSGFGEPKPIYPESQLMESPWQLADKVAPCRAINLLAPNEIQIAITPLSKKFYYSSALKDHVNSDIFKKYYTALPQESPPDSFYSYTYPGIPNVAYHLKNTLFSLGEVNCVSRFGGTIHLLFESENDYGIEVRQDDRLWDVDTLKLSIYVSPNKKVINKALEGSPPDSAAMKDAYVFAELMPQGVTAYNITSSIGNSRKVVIRSDDDSMDILQAKLDEIARDIEKKLHGDAVRFSHGLLHSVFKDRFTSPKDLVGNIEMSNDHVDIETTVGQSYFGVIMRVADINLNTEAGAEEIEIKASIDYLVTTGPTITIGHTFDDLSNHDSTPFYPYGGFHLSKCGAGAAIPGVNGMLVYFDVNEHETTAGTDKFSSDTQELPLDCEMLKQMSQAGDYGMVEEFEFMDRPLKDRFGGNQDIKGSISFTAQIWLRLR